MVTELKTIHSFWTPVRTLEKLQSTVKELRKVKGIKISTNQLAMRLIDAGLNNEQTLMNVIIKEAPPKDAVVKMVPATTQRRPIGMANAYVNRPTLTTEEADSSTG